MINPILERKLEEVGIKQFLNDENITDIAINKPYEIWVQNKEWQKIDVPTASLENLQQLVTLIANSNKIEIDHEQPMMSVQLPTGERVQALVSPATLDNNISITIRRFSKETKSLEQLNAGGTFNQFKWIKFTDYSMQENLNKLTTTDKELIQHLNDKDILSFLRKAVLKHKNIVLIGRTGSGKTYVTRSLIDEIPKTERIITIEDVHELFLNNHQNKVHLIFGAGKHRTTAKQSLAACMRMKPDRIFLAEIRGDEAWDYISSLNTGHPGSITSVHANGAIEAYTRIASLIKSTSTGSTLDINYIEYELYNTIHITMFYENRKLTELFFDPVYSKTRDKS